MTAEESKLIWELEKKNTNFDALSKPLQKLFKTVDKAIYAEVISYEEFTNDMIDGVTDCIVANTKNGEDKERAEVIENIAERLIKKYNAKYKARKSLGRNKKDAVDNTEVQNEPRIYASSTESTESTGITETIS